MRCGKSGIGGFETAPFALLSKEGWPRSGRAGYQKVAKPPFMPTRSALLRFFSGLIGKKANARGGFLRLLVENIPAAEKSPIIPQEAIRELPRWATVASVAIGARSALSGFCRNLSRKVAKRALPSECHHRDTETRRHRDTAKNTVFSRISMLSAGRHSR